MDAPTAMRFKHDSTCARCVGAIALLYMLNAFVQSSDWLTVPELLVGVVWLCACVVTSRWLNVWGILGLSFAASVIWGFIVDSQPASDFLGFHSHAARLAGGADMASLLGSKSPPTVAYYAVFQVVFGSSYATNYVAGALAWSAGSFGVYKAILTWGADERRALFVCALLALYPSFVVYAVVPSSESSCFCLPGHVLGCFLGRSEVRDCDGRASPRWSD